MLQLVQNLLDCTLFWLVERSKWEYVCKAKAPSCRWQPQPIDRTSRKLSSKKREMSWGEWECFTKMDLTEKVLQVHHELMNSCPPTYQKNLPKTSRNHPLSLSNLWFCEGNKINIFLGWRLFLTCYQAIYTWKTLKTALYHVSSYSSIAITYEPKKGNESTPWKRKCGCALLSPATSSFFLQQPVLSLEHWLYWLVNKNKPHQSFQRGWVTSTCGI